MTPVPPMNNTLFALMGPFSRELPTSAGQAALPTRDSGQLANVTFRCSAIRPTRTPAVTSKDARHRRIRPHDRQPADRDQALPAPRGLRGAGERDGRGLADGRRRPGRVLGGGRATARLGRALAHRAHLGPPVVDGPTATSPSRRREWFAGGTLNVAVNCVDRHVAAGRGDKVALHFEGEPRRPARDQLRRAAARGLAAPRNALDRARRREGRPRRRLPAGDRRDRHRHPRDRPDRRHPLARLRRLLAPRRCGSASRTPARSCSSRRDGQYRRGQAVAGQGRTPTPRSPASERVEHVLVVRRTGTRPGRAVDRRPRRLVARRRRHRARRARGRGVRRRDPAVHHLHVRHHREAEGPRAHLGRLPHPARPGAHWAHLRRASPTTCTGAPPTSPGSPRTPTRSTDRSPTALTQVIYEGTPDTPAPRAALRDHRALRRDDLLHGADPHPDVHDLVPATARPPGTTCRGSACSARSARRSTPRRGSGSAARSARTARPIVDTWWQSETGAAVIAPLPGVIDAQARAPRTRALPGISAPSSSTTPGDEVPSGEGGLLVVDRPVARRWPARLGRPRALPRLVLGTVRRRSGLLLLRRRREVRRRRRHLAARPGRRRHQRLRAPALDHRDRVRARRAPARSARPASSACTDAITGQAIAAFVVPATRPPDPPTDSRLLAGGHATNSARCCGHRSPARSDPIAKPRDVVLVPDLPKTRSGKIMRRLLGDISDGTPARRRDKSAGRHGAGADRRDPPGGPHPLIDQTGPAPRSGPVAHRFRASAARYSGSPP